jgi:DNA repair exonuclease SbcCD ATPase subunit
MKMIKRVILTTLLLAFAGNCMSAQAQRRPIPNDRLQPGQLRQDIDDLLIRIQRESSTFSRSLDTALDDSRVNNTNREDSINQLAKDIRDNATLIRDRFRNRQRIREDVQTLLTKARRMDALMQRFPRSSDRDARSSLRDAQQNWTNLRTDLTQLENMFNRNDRFDRF